jgi:hypothetical protein
LENSVNISSVGNGDKEKTMLSKTYKDSGGKPLDKKEAKKQKKKEKEEKKEKEKKKIIF